MNLVALRAACAISDPEERQKAVEQLLSQRKKRRTIREEVYRATEQVLDEWTMLPADLSLTGEPESIQWVLELTDADVERLSVVEPPPPSTEEGRAKLEALKHFARAVVAEEAEVEFDENPFDETPLYPAFRARLTDKGWAKALKKRTEWKMWGWQDLFVQVSAKIPRNKRTNEVRTDAAVRPYCREYMFVYCNWREFPPRFVDGHQSWADERDRFESFADHIDDIMDTDERLATLRAEQAAALPAKAREGLALLLKTN